MPAVLHDQQLLELFDVRGPGESVRTIDQTVLDETRERLFERE